MTDPVVQFDAQIDASARASILACLQSDPAKRPTMREVCIAISGRVSTVEVPRRAS